MYEESSILIFKNYEKEELLKNLLQLEKECIASNY